MIKRLTRQTDKWANVNFVINNFTTPIYYRYIMPEVCYVLSFHVKKQLNLLNSSCICFTFFKKKNKNTTLYHFTFASTITILTSAIPRLLGNFIPKNTQSTTLDRTGADNSSPHRFPKLLLTRLRKHSWIKMKAGKKVKFTISHSEHIGEDTLKIIQRTEMENVRVD